MSKHVAVLAKKKSTRKVLVGATTIGIDLGDQWSHYCVLDEAGEVLEEGRFRTTEGGVGKRFEDMESARIAMEAGTHSIWISALIAGKRAALRVF
jgi:transposase